MSGLVVMKKKENDPASVFLGAIGTEQREEWLISRDLSIFIC